MIIILYFIQIRHTDDFPSTRIPASVYKSMKHHKMMIEQCAVISAAPNDPLVLRNMQMSTATFPTDS